MTALPRELLVLGVLSPELRQGVKDAAHEASFAAEFFDPERDAARVDARAPSAIVLDQSAAARRLCLELRAQAQHAHVPMLSLDPNLGDLSFADVFSWGGDDAVDVTRLHALVQRLRSLPADVRTPPRNGRGAALIVDADRARRIVRGRVLRNAGYSVGFAISGDDALARVREQSPKLVVASSEVTAEPGKLLASAREAGSSATWIITCPPKDLPKARPQVESLGNATVTDGFAPPENIVFLANELERGGALDKRASRRLLYGTSVSFRAAGRDEDDLGYTYNISMGGVYVRTLAPPDEEIVWLEFKPPRSERRVRLEGRVVWRRKFGPAETATVPPGFGVALTDATKRDLAAWNEGYTAFAGALGY
jgi:DNA-binding response OmpR family regulator